MARPELVQPQYGPVLQFVAIDGTGVPQPLVMDAAGNLQMGAGGGLTSTFISGTATVSTGTQTLGSNANLHFVTLQSSYVNTGNIIYWGATGYPDSMELAAGDSTAPIPLANTNLITFNSGTSGAILKWYAL